MLTLENDGRVERMKTAVLAEPFSQKTNLAITTTFVYETLDLTQPATVELGVCAGRGEQIAEKLALKLADGAPEAFTVTEQYDDHKKRSDDFRLQVNNGRPTYLHLELEQVNNSRNQSLLHVFLSHRPGPEARRRVLSVPVDHSVLGDGPTFIYLRLRGAGKVTFHEFQVSELPARTTSRGR